MPLSVAKKLNAKWDKIDAQIVEVDRSLFYAICEIRNVLIRLLKTIEFNDV